MLLLKFFLYFEMNFSWLAKAEFAFVCEVKTSLSSPGFDLSGLRNSLEDLLEL